MEEQAQQKRQENLIEHLLNSDDEGPALEPLKRSKSSFPFKPSSKLNPLSDREAVVSDLVSEIE